MFNYADLVGLNIKKHNSMQVPPNETGDVKEKEVLVDNRESTAGGLLLSFDLLCFRVLVCSCK